MTMTQADDNLATADVYPGDRSCPTLSSESATSVYLFAIEADAEPDVLARTAGVFNLANTAPRSASLRRKSSEQLYIAVEIERISATTADMIRRKLLQLTCIISVELTVHNTVREDA
jgi:hypothetical protein